MDWLSYLSEHIGKIAAALASAATIGYFARRLYNWGSDKVRRQNRAWLEFQVKYLRDKSYVPCFLLDAKSLECIDVNEALLRLFSAGNRSFEGTNWFRLVDPHELSGVITAWKQAARNKSSYTNETKMILPDGTRLTMLITAEPFVYANKCRAFIGTAKIVSRGEMVKR